MKGHAQKIQEILGLSRAESFKKLNGTSALAIGQLEKIAAHFKEPLETLIADSPSAIPDVGQKATVEISGKKFPALVRVGKPLKTIKGSIFVARRNGRSIEVLEALNAPPAGIYYEVRKLELDLSRLRRTRVAILDDDRGAADGMSESLEQRGYEAHSFYEAKALASEIDFFDCFVLDWKLRGETAEGIISQIRSAKPKSPVILLTGQAVEPDDENNVARLVKEFRLEGMAKPGSPVFVDLKLREELGEVEIR